MSRLALLTITLLVIPSCAMVGPDFKIPESDFNAQWQAVNEGLIADEGQISDTWWENFQDPVLDELIQRTYDNNLGLQIAGLRVYEARALLGFAAGNLYPQVQSLNASRGKYKISENSDLIATLPTPIGDLIETDYYRTSNSFDVAWELDFWGRYRRGVEASEANLAATYATYDDVLVTLTAEVARTYIMMRTLEERLVVAQNNEAIQKRSLDIASVRARNGLVTELDVYLAKSLLENTRAIIPIYQAAIHQSRLALALLMGLPPTELTDLLGGGGTVPETPEAVALGLPADLLRRRPDIRRNAHLAAAQSARIGIAKSDLYPSFKLLGSIGVSAAGSGDLYDSESEFGFGVISFNWNILNYGRTKNKIRMQDARFEQAVLNYKNSVLNAAREVETNLTNFQKAKERVEALNKSVAASARAVELAQAQYRDGVVSYTLVLDAQQFLLLNENQLAGAKGAVAKSLVATYKALGGGWAIREGSDLISTDTKESMQDRSNWGELLEVESIEPVAADERGKWQMPSF